MPQTLEKQKRFKLMSESEIKAVWMAGFSFASECENAPEDAWDIWRAENPDIGRIGGGQPTQ